MAESTSRSRGGETSESAWSGADEVGDDLRIDDDPAGGHHGERVEEVRHSSYPFFEQVSDPAISAVQEFLDVGAGDVRGEDHQRQSGVFLADRETSTQAVVGAVRRHPDVGDDDVGFLVGADSRFNGGDQAGSIGDGGDHAVSGSGEDGDKSLSDQGGVLGQHDSHDTPLTTPFPTVFR